MLHLLGGVLAFGLMGQATVWLVANVLYPLFVVWMIVDGVLRDVAEYPGATQNNKIVWVLLMVFIHPVALVYFFCVFRKIKRGSTGRAPVPA